MSRRAFTLVAAVLCFTLMPFIVRAQSSVNKPTTRTDKRRNANTPSADVADADPLAEIRRTTAVSLVLSLADEARSFRDATLAARVQARSADALWEADNERARALFRRAWDAADAADRENLRRQEEERRKQEAETGAYAQIRVPNLRAEVLRLAARRDRELGEEFLAKLDEAKKQYDESGKAQAESALTQLDPTHPTQSINQRLELAQSLIADDMERALQFADPVLNRVTLQGLSFLSNLRQKNPKAADERYARMLQRAALDPATDANTVSLLSSYIFTPFLYITSDPDGGISSSRLNEGAAPSDIAPALRNAFLTTAAQVLLRPLPQPEQDRTTSGRKGLYFIIARLLPLFDQYLPERSAPLRAQMAALAQNVSEDMRDGRNEWLKEGLEPENSEDSGAKEVQNALDRAEHETNPQRRDQAYSVAAMAAAAKGDARARDYADKIEDGDTRKAAHAFVDYQLANSAVNRKDAQEALRLARTGELTNIQRVWFYTAIARLLMKTDPVRATEILDDAAAEAARIGTLDPDHARALVAVATTMFEMNKGRGWELMSEAVKASNSAEGYTGEDGRVAARFITKNSASIVSSTVSEFDLAGIFTSLAKDDFNRAIELAKEFKTEAPRSAATLAIARSVLNEKQKRQ